MGTEKIRIASDRGPTNDVEPLKAVIDYCLTHGNHSNTENGYFLEGKNNKSCFLRGSITASDLESVFIFPNHITIRCLGTSGEIRDWKHKTRVYFSNRNEEIDSLANLKRWTGDYESFENAEKSHQLETKKSENPHELVAAFAAKKQISDDATDKSNVDAKTSFYGFLRGVITVIRLMILR